MDANLPPELSLAERRRRRQRGQTEEQPVAPKRSGLGLLRPYSRSTAVVATEQGAAAVTALQRASSKGLLATTFVAAGIGWLTLALFADRVVGSYLKGGVAIAMTAFVLAWLLAPLLPSNRTYAFGGVGSVAVTLGLAVAFLDPLLPGGFALCFFASLTLAGAVDFAGVAWPQLRSLRHLRHFLPGVVVVALLYVPGASALGRALAPITPLATGVGAAAAVAWIFQDQLGLSAVAYRHGRADGVEATLTRVCEIPRSLWLLLSDALAADDGFSTPPPASVREG